MTQERMSLPVGEYDPDFVIHPPAPGMHSRPMSQEELEHAHQALKDAGVPVKDRQPIAEAVTAKRKKRGVEEPEATDMATRILETGRELADLNVPIHGSRADQGIFTTYFDDPIGVLFEFDMVRAGRDADIQAAVTIRRVIIGKERRLVGPTRGTISGPMGRNTLSKLLIEADPRLKSVASVIVELACVETIEAFRTGDPMVWLQDVDLEDDQEKFLVDPLVYDGNPTIIFGDGGSGKSYVGMALAAGMGLGRTMIPGINVLRQVTVGYLDWEMTAKTHRKRLETITGPLTERCRLAYIPCSAPLAHDVDRLRRMRREHGIDFWVVDSIAPACDGEPESAEVAKNFFNALRALGGGSLSIAHISKSNANSDQKPFGSAFWHNLARLTWFAQGSATDDGINVGLFNRKNNLGKLLSPLAITIDFDAEYAGFRRTSVEDDPDLSRKLPILRQMAALLDKGPMKAHQIADELGVSLEEVKRAGEKGLQNGSLTYTKGSDEVFRWELADR